MQRILKFTFMEWIFPKNKKSFQYAIENFWFIDYIGNDVCLDSKILILFTISWKVQVMCVMWLSLKERINFKVRKRPYLGSNSKVQYRCICVKKMAFVKKHWIKRGPYAPTVEQRPVAIATAALRKPCTSELYKGKQSPLEDIQCCKKLKCFETYGLEYLRTQQTVMMQETQNESSAL